MLLQLIFTSSSFSSRSSCFLFRWKQPELPVNGPKVQTNELYDNSSMVQNTPKNVFTLEKTKPWFSLIRTKTTSFRLIKFRVFGPVCGLGRVHTCKFGSDQIETSLGRKKKGP